jgi:hypothetical protein
LGCLVYVDASEASGRASGQSAPSSSKIGAKRARSRSNGSEGQKVWSGDGVVNATVVEMTMAGGLR